LGKRQSNKSIVRDNLTVRLVFESDCLGGGFCYTRLRFPFNFHDKTITADKETRGSKKLIKHSMNRCHGMALEKPIYYYPYALRPFTVRGKAARAGNDKLKQLIK